MTLTTTKTKPLYSLADYMALLGEDHPAVDEYRALLAENAALTESNLALSKALADALGAGGPVAERRRL
jgi:hypothetical protein